MPRKPSSVRQALHTNPFHLDISSSSFDQSSLSVYSVFVLDLHISVVVSLVDVAGNMNEIFIKFFC